MMDDKTITTRLASLAHPVRFAVLRLLMRAGPKGLAAGRVAARLDIAANALSFHLQKLAGAGLIVSQRDGQFIYYAARFDVVRALAGSLTQACCAQSVEKCAEDCQIGEGGPDAALMNAQKEHVDV